MSAPTVQKIALAANRDGLDHPDIKLLAGLESANESTNNE